LTSEIEKLLRIKVSPQRAVLDEFLKKVRKNREVEKIILFGSVAKGKESLTSDVDIALLVRHKNKQLEDKITKIVDDIAARSKIMIVPLLLTFKELYENRQFQEELNRGEVLYVRRKRS
jgi:predicted nucleotidyltransferase